MDLVASCKDKLAYFRIKELKDILTQLGLSKQGKKQDLVDRILAILSNERGILAKKNAVGKDEVAKLVDDTYRKMQVSGAAELASKSQGILDIANAKLKEESEDSYQMDKMRCLCGSTLPTDSMIKCEDPRCNVWQHMRCVLIPEKPMDGVLPNPPETFYCEICRLNRADPFSMTVAHPLSPVKLNIMSVSSSTDGSNPCQNIERTFQLTSADKDLLSKQEYDVQAWCMLLNDKVIFRMQWPQYPDLQVNGEPVRVINRPGSQLLGANGRDDGPIITTYTRDGINKIYLSGCDARIFCVGVRIVKRLTVHQIVSMIPKEAEGEHFEEALARVRRCVGGGAATENADSDTDIEVVADFIPVNLRCPMSGLRMKVAGRFKPCAHMGCFDLEVFVEMNQRSRKWQCPICLKNYSWEKIIIDPYFNRITTMMRNSGEDVADIEVKPDGSWRAKAEGDRRSLGELGLWHLPDGTICVSTDAESKPKPELKPIKQEAGSVSHAGLKLENIKKRDVCWEFNEPDNMHGISPSNGSRENFENNIPMSSSATGSGKDGEDTSVNHNGNLNSIDYEFIPMDDEPGHGINNQLNAMPTRDAEVIVLSDSEDEIERPIRAGAVYKNTGPDNGGVLFPAPQHGISDSYYENPAICNSGNSCLGPYNTHEDEFGNMWSPLPSGNQGLPSFQFFGSEADVSDPLVDMQHVPLNCSSSINGYALAPETAMGSAAVAPESNANDALVDYPLAFSGNDPALQIFLPSRPSDASVMQSDLRDHPDVSNGIPTEDWISLRIGDGIGEAAAPNGLGVGQELQTKDGSLDALAEQASILLGTNNNRAGQMRRERTDSPFSFPRQRRSVRPRLFLSIGSDSE